MAGVASKTALEILDIRHFTARQLRPLLEREARRWEQRLRWDYESATNLLLQYLDSRLLPGFVALDRGHIAGYAFCVYEGTKAVIGDAFAVDNQAMKGLATAEELLRHLLYLLLQSPQIERIEGQLLLYDAAEISRPFDESGFRRERRLFLEMDLGQIQADGGNGSVSKGVPEGLNLERWAPADYEGAAELIRVAYVGHIDAQINDQYRTLHGSLRFLHNIVRFPGCGTFDANASWVLRDRGDGSLAGIALCSRVRGDTAHLTQLCVAPAYRGKKMGELLLHHAMRKLASERTEALTLTVTEANRAAVDLYRKTGFAVRHTFDAHTLTVSERTGAGAATNTSNEERAWTGPG